MPGRQELFNTDRLIHRTAACGRADATRPGLSQDRWELVRRESVRSRFDDPSALPTIRALVLAVLIATGVGARRAEARAPSSDELLEWPVVFVRLPVVPGLELADPLAGGMLRRAYGDGGRIVRLEPDGTLRILTKSFHSACELDISFDADRILFTAKREKTDPWSIWEISADGSGARRITQIPADCRTPAYLATFYTIVSAEPWYQVVFSSDLAGAMREYGPGAALSLYSCRLNGTGVRRLTMNLSDDLDPFLMRDGRVLLAGWQRADLRRGILGRIALFGVNTDGTDYSLFCGDQGRRIKHMPCVTTDGLVVFVEAERVPWDGAGQLGSVTLRRNFHSYRPLTQDPSELYHSPSPLPDGRILVSARPANGASPHAMFRFDPRNGRRDRVFADPQFHVMHARVLASRPEPDGRSSVVDERHPTGKLYCLNAYTAGTELMPHLQPGAIKRLRVIEGVPLPVSRRDAYLGPGRQAGLGGQGSTVSGRAPIVRKRLLGVVDVADDGSFHLEVPADVPLQLQTLDQYGIALESCGWIWVKHREARGCIGCHEDPELTPENRFVSALRQPAFQLTLPEERRRTVSFHRDVMPMIAAKCVVCHDSQSTGVDLRDEPGVQFNRAYESLLAAAPDPGKPGEDLVGRYVHPGRARTSPLTWRLWGRNTSRPWDEEYHRMPWSATCPPAGGKALTEDEKLLLVEWIDLGAHWDHGLDFPVSGATSGDDMSE